MPDIMRFPPYGFWMWCIGRLESCDDRSPEDTILRVEIVMERVTYLSALRKRQIL